MMNFSNDNGLITIALEGDFNSAILNDFRAVILNETEAGNMSFKIDFNGAELIDSMGIGCLVATYNALRHKGGTLELINLPENLKDILRVVRLERIFAVA